MGIPLEYDKTVIILDELKFDWKESALEVVVELWNKGMTAKEVASYFRITFDEAFLVLFHLARTDKIKQRPGGLMDSAI